MRCLPLADDCGVSSTNVKTIMRCIDAGSLRGSSVLAGGCAVKEAVAALCGRLEQIPDLRIGVHLNLLEGKCTASAQSIPLLVDTHGVFRHSLGSLLLTFMRFSQKQRVSFLDQVILEWHAQFEYVRQLCRETLGRDIPVYIDGHQHVHAIPFLQPALASLLDSPDIIHVRVPIEKRYAVPASFSLLLAGIARRELLALWGHSLRRLLETRNIFSPDYFIGAFCSGCMTMERLEAGLKVLAGSDSLVEIMLHPGGMAQEEARGENTFTRFYLAQERKQEEALLLSSRFQHWLDAHPLST